jgi:hypothetical protein
MTLANPAMTADPARFKFVVESKDKPDAPHSAILSKTKLTLSLNNRLG